MSSFSIKLNSILIFIIVVITNLNAQSQITGKITDARTNNPLVGANIQILGTIYGASTDGDGIFRIPKLPTGRYSLQVSMIGYRNQVKKDIFVDYNKVTEINFELHESPISFDPIVVTAGKTKQRLDQVPVSLSVISAEDIKQRNPEHWRRRQGFIL